MSATYRYETRKAPDLTYELVTVIAPNGARAVIPFGAEGFEAAKKGQFDPWKNGSGFGPLVVPTAMQEPARASNSPTLQPKARPGYDPLTAPSFEPAYNPPTLQPARQEWPPPGKEPNGERRELSEAERETLQQAEEDNQKPYHVPLAQLGEEWRERRKADQWNSRIIDEDNIAINEDVDYAGEGEDLMAAALEDFDQLVDDEAERM